MFLSCLHSKNYGQNHRISPTTQPPSPSLPIPHPQHLTPLTPHYLSLITQHLTQVYHPLSPNLTVTVLSSFFLWALCPTNFILFEW